jgi:hypothetical protein
MYVCTYVHKPEEMLVTGSVQIATLSHTVVGPDLP